MKKLFLLAVILLPTVISPRAFAEPLSQPSIFSIDNAPWTPAYTLKVERAIQGQVAQELAPHWPVGQPWITTGDPPGSIQVSFEPLASITTDCHAADALGCHGIDNGVPWIVVALGTSIETMTMDHEILETLVDPDASTTINGQLVEICDPVESFSYKFDGVQLSAFVYPNYYTAQHIGTPSDAFGLPWWTALHFHPPS